MNAPPDECANCGAAVPRTARACPECGADERTGWRETSVYDDLDLPESAFADDRQAQHPPQGRKINGVAWYWWAAAVCLVLLLLSAIVGN